jgi:hypothetical protein
MKSRRVRWERHAACMTEMENAGRILVGKPEKKKLLDRLGYKWEDIGT